MEEDDWGYMGGVGGDSCRLGGRWRRRIRDCPNRDNAISEVFFGDDTATEHGGGEPRPAARVLGWRYRKWTDFVPIFNLTVEIDS
jgi:hypothetical protein